MRACYVRAMSVTNMLCASALRYDVRVARMPEACHAVCYGARRMLREKRNGHTKQRQLRENVTRERAPRRYAFTQRHARCDVIMRYCAFAMLARARQQRCFRYMRRGVYECSMRDVLIFFAVTQDAAVAAASALTSFYAVDARCRDVSLFAAMPFSIRCHVCATPFTPLRR